MDCAFQQKMNFFRENEVTNWHEHLFIRDLDYEVSAPRARKLVQDMKLCGVDRTVITCCITNGARAPMEVISKGNDTYGMCCAEFPGILYPLAFADPFYGEQAIAEVARCKKEYNVLGVKLYNQYTIDDDIQDKLLEYCADNGLIVLMHAACMPKDDHSQPNITNSVHMARAAKKHPNTKMIMAHIPGGGDWNHQLRGLDDLENVYVDISGSVLDADMVEALVRRIGADRVLFGTDGSFSAAIGRTLAANISDSERKMIMHNTTLWDYAMGGKK